MARILQGSLKPARIFALAALGMTLAPVRAQETVLHSFVRSARGTSPNTVIRDQAGNIFGTTSGGGKWNSGVVFMLDAAGKLTVLHSFMGGSDGAHPNAGVVRDSHGNLYGTTYFGGASNAGTVYKVNATGQETVLYSFTGWTDGAAPIAGVILDSAGNLYGTTTWGGTPNQGVVYKLDPAGQETVLYTFTGGADGANPYASLAFDSAGNLYGTTFSGGSGQGYFGYGVVFKVNTAGQETVLYNFTGGLDGGAPSSGLIRDSAGTLFGTTAAGGAGNIGVVYKLNAAGQETVLYSFTGRGNTETPSGLIRDSSGNLYGTSPYGGPGDSGMVYKLDPAGNFSLLFNGGSSTGLVRDSAGNLYGTNWTLGPGQGTVNKLDPSGQETTLYSFTYGPDGMNPYGALIRDAAGNLFGTASLGGTTNNGMVFKLDTAGHETVLHSFTGADGNYPVAGLVRDADGNFYGTTLDGGPWDRGVVYKLSTGGQLTDLYAFTGAADGGSPGAGVTLDSAGNLYGTAGNGGATQYGGVVFQLDTTGHLTVLHAFTGGSDGANPYAGVIRDAEGNLYGTTLFGGNMGLGVVYKVAKTGNETVLHSFSGSDGANPFGGLIRDSAGNLYGTTEVGGAWGAGTVYKLDPQGGLTTLYSFTGAADGAYPHSGVVRDSAGNLYGTAWGPSNSGLGVVYKVDPNGQETVLYSFTGGIDGGTPFAGVVLGAGTLYGVTMGGGDDNAGVVFSVPD